MKRNLKKFVTVSGVLLTTLGMLLFLSCSKDSTNFTNGGGNGGGGNGGGGDGGGGDGAVPVLSENPFITTWEDTNTVTIPMNPNFDYDFVVQWEEGEIEQVRQGRDQDKADNGEVMTVSHTFSGSGPHTISISGDFPAIQFGGIETFDATMSSKIIAVERWGDIEWESMERAFTSCPNLEITNNDNPDISGVTNFANMFEDAEEANPKMGSWDFTIKSNETDMDRMLDDCGMSDQNYHDMLERLASRSPNNADVRLTARGLDSCLGILGNVAGPKQELKNKGWSVTDSGATNCNPVFDTDCLINPIKCL